MPPATPRIETKLNIKTFSSLQIYYVCLLYLSTSPNKDDGEVLSSENVFLLLLTIFFLVKKGDKCFIALLSVIILKFDFQNF